MQTQITILEPRTLGADDASRGTTCWFNPIIT